MSIHVLAVTDEIDQRIYSATLRERMSDVQLVFSCGDLPARYLEFLADALDKPVYYVLGNHAAELTRTGERGKRQHPLGCVDLGGKVTRDESTGLLIAGLPGSPKYCEHEPEQYSEWQVLMKIAAMAPRLWLNKLRYGRALDVLITHSPPRDINDREDVAHRGFKALRRFLDWFRPVYHLHGHVHLYDRSKPNVARFLDTKVINVYPYQTLDIEVPALTPQLQGAPAGTTLPARASSPELEPE